MVTRQCCAIVPEAADSIVIIRWKKWRLLTLLLFLLRSIRWVQVWMVTWTTFEWYTRSCILGPTWEMNCTGDWNLTLTTARGEGSVVYDLVVIRVLGGYTLWQPAHQVKKLQFDKSHWPNKIWLRILRLDVSRKRSGGQFSATVHCLIM